MRSRFLSVLGVLVAVGGLVLASNTVALATTGHGLIAGRSGSKHAATFSRSTHGPALVLHTRGKGDAPLAVNGGGKVVHLNADRVDGLDSSVLRTHTTVFIGDPYEDQKRVVFEPPLQPGSYLVSYSNFFADVDAGGLECYVETFTEHTDEFDGYSSLVQPANAGWSPSLTGTALVTKTRDNHVIVLCDAQGSSTFSSEDEIPVQITVTPTVLVGSHALHQTLSGTAMLRGPAARR